MRFRSTTGLKRYHGDRVPGRGNPIRAKRGVADLRCASCGMFGGLHLDTCQLPQPMPEKPKP